MWGPYGGCTDFLLPWAPPLGPVTQARGWCGWCSLAFSLCCLGLKCTWGLHSCNRSFTVTCLGLEVSILCKCDLNPSLEYALFIKTKGLHGFHCNSFKNTTCDLQGPSLVSCLEKQRFPSPQGVCWQTASQLESVHLCVLRHSLLVFTRPLPSSVPSSLYTLPHTPPRAVQHYQSSRGFDSFTEAIVLLFGRVRKERVC